MRLTYRGASYESNQPAIQSEAGEHSGSRHSEFDNAAGDLSGNYRGANWRHHYPRHIPVPQPAAQLNYRGVGYCIGDPIDVELMLLRGRNDRASTPTKEAISMVCTRKEVLDQLNDIHLANIRQSLERRLEVARAKDDQNLISLLEAEAKQMASP